MPPDTLEMLLRSFKLPSMAARCGDALRDAEAGNWGYRRFLSHLCEAEAADRRQRRVERLIRESGLPGSKTMGNLEEEQIGRAHV